MNRITLIKPPVTYRYNGLDVREESILTYLGGYLESVGFQDFTTFDFHLQRDLTFDHILDASTEEYVVSVRETGDSVHYALRLANALSERTSARIWLYGHTARLNHLSNLPSRVSLCQHNESELATRIGIKGEAASFETGLKSRPYFTLLNLEEWQLKRFKASIETTRGCHYPCKFCFINAGYNHSKKWQVRPIDAILSDLRQYQLLGITNIVFSDSEFLGADVREHLRKGELLKRMIEELSPVNYKIYARGDTLLKFGNWDLLKKSGLVSVFMGVESLYQPDLDTLKKNTSVETLVEAIKSLRDRSIYMVMSFILFNRNASTASIRANLDHLQELFASPNSRYLGMPYFLFGFESGWSVQKTQTLSSQTYIAWDVLMKTQPMSGACFDVSLEPLMEIYRLLAYEWGRKTTQLNLARDGAGEADIAAIESWFSSLGKFCLQIMYYFLELFENGHLKLENLGEARDELFEMIQKYHNQLPPHLKNLETYDAHAGQLEYGKEVSQLEGDEYWENQIPFSAMLANSIS